MKAGSDPLAPATDLGRTGLRLEENLDPTAIEARYFQGRSDRRRAVEHVHLAGAVVARGSHLEVVPSRLAARLVAVRGSRYPIRVISIAPDSPSTSRLGRTPLAVMALGLVLVVGGVLAVPPDTILKGTTRLVFFHGAVVWTAIILGLTSTILGAVVLLGGAGARGDRPTAGGDAGAAERRASGDGVHGDAAHGAIVGGRPRTLWRLYSLATLFWVLTLVLSFPVMKASWGGIRWDETRLRMTFEVVFVYLVVWGVVYVALLDRAVRLFAGVLAATGVVMFLLVALTPGNFHPDNPVFRSGNPRYIGGFLVILAGLLCLSVGAAVLRRQDAPARFLGEPGVDAGV